MTTREIAGKTVEFDKEGFMSNPADWNRDIATVLAQEIGIAELSEGHWKVIDFCRKDFNEKGEAPSFRRLKKAGGIPTKELYQLFPKGPAKKVALVSGLGKPKGCI